MKMMSKTLFSLLFIITANTVHSQTCSDFSQSCSPSPKIISTSLTPEGDGAKVRRIIGSNRLKSLDPFLLFDHFYVSPPAGFPDHPHRGFITLTYIIAGTCQHEDFLNNKGEINEGDIQWMTAGRGIVHSEMPKNGEMTGIQLWINLKASEKMSVPKYQELKSSEFPIIQTEKFKAKILVGKMLNETSPIVPNSPVEIFDLNFEDGGIFEYWVLENWSLLVYVIKGSIESQGSKVGENMAGVWEKGLVMIKSIGKSRVLVVAGEKIGEKVVQHGPFVMNTQTEINQAIQDYRTSSNGFEGASKWKSTISK